LVTSRLTCSPKCSRSAVEIAARIDDGALHGFVTPQNGAVLGERRDRNDSGFQHRRFADLVHDMCGSGCAGASAPLDAAPEFGRFYAAWSRV
jgi:hypothetical protein